MMYAVALVFTKPVSSGMDIQLQLATMDAESESDALGRAVPEVWKAFKGYQLNNVVVTACEAGGSAASPAPGGTTT